MTTTTVTTTTVSTTTVPEYKVFIGNLSFKSTKESLRAFAESTGGKVVEATIINKGTRSLGYGFVTFATEEDMKKAAVDLNHKELEGREINVEIARPKTIVETNDNDNNKPRKAKRNTRQKSKTPKKKNGKEEPTSSSSSDGEEVSNNKQKKENTLAGEKVTIDKSNISSSESSFSSSENSEKEEQEEGVPTHRQQKNRTSNNNKKRSVNKNKKKPTTNNNNKRQVERVSEPSKTTLFIANLPYATTIDDIKKIFEDYKIVSAHVTRMNNGRSKGYGFVEFENEEEQQKALQNVKDIVLDGRAVYLKVALSDQHNEKNIVEKVEALEINDTKN